VSNRFFDWVLSAARFIPYTWARAGEVNSSLDNVSTGFTLVQDEIDENLTRSIRLPVGQDGEITDAAVDRASRVLTFDASGLPYIFPPDDAAVRADKVFAWDSSGNPILASNGAPYAWLPSQTGNANKILKTDGSVPSWLATALTQQTGHAGKFLYSNGSVDSWQYSIPTGTVAFFPVGITPTGWVRCDGSDLVSADYPEIADYFVPKVTVSAFLPFHANWQGYADRHKVIGSYIFRTDYGTAARSYSDDHGSTWKSTDASFFGPYSVPGDGYFYRNIGTSLYRATSFNGQYSEYASSGFTTQVSGFMKLGANYVSTIHNATTPHYSTSALLAIVQCTPAAGTFCLSQYLSISGTTVYAVASGSGSTTLQKSTDGGETWTTASTVDGGLAWSQGKVVIKGTDFLVHNGTIGFTATSDAGPWTAITLPAACDTFDGMVAFGGYYWFCYNLNFYRSPTGATGTWSSVVPSGTTILSNSQVLVTNATTPRLYLVKVQRSSPAASGQYVQWTTDGTTWNTEWAGQGRVSFGAYGGTVKVGSYYAHAWADGIAPVYSSTPDGFCSLSATTTVEVYASNPTIATDGTNAYIIGRSGGSNYLYKSTNGTTWSAVGAAMGTTPTSKLCWGGGKLFAATTTNFFMCDGTVAMASSSLPGTLAGTVTVNYVAGKFVVWGGAGSTTMYVSADGVTWFTRASAVLGYPVVGDPNGTEMFCGGYRSDDYGVSWEQDAGSSSLLAGDSPSVFMDDGTIEIGRYNSTVTVRKKSSGAYNELSGPNSGRFTALYAMKEGVMVYYFQTSVFGSTYQEASLKAEISTTDFTVPNITTYDSMAYNLRTWMYVL
jgi:hypothetical protein